MVTRTTPARKSSSRAPRQGAREAKPAAKRNTARKPAAAPAHAAPEAVPPAKTAKLKLVRDSFTIPAGEYGVLAELKRRTAVLGRPAKKSELLRAGLKLLAALGDAQLSAAMAAVPSIKTGRPKGKKGGRAEGGPSKKGKAASSAA
jgi:hypothetical protein